MDLEYLLLKYREHMLWYANTQGGQYLLSKLLHSKIDYPIVDIGGHYIIGQTEEKSILQAKFLLNNDIASTFIPIFEKINLALHSKDDRLFSRILENPYQSFLHFSGLEENRSYPKIYLDTRTFNPNGGGNGIVYNDNAGTWATVRALTTGTVSSNPSNTNVYASFLSSISIGRGFFPFNTAALSGGTLIAGSNTLAFTVNTVLGSSGQLDLIQTSQASNTSLASGDFDNVTFTDGGNVAVATTGLKTITLNGTGEGYIDFTGGFSKLGLLENHDLTNTDPGASDYRFNLDFAGGSVPPVLTVNYTNVSPSASASKSASASQSPSSSTSASASKSLSPSASASKSVSPSLSPSSSASRSLSPSPSASPSVSESKSASASPSPGFEDYTRGELVTLPLNDNDLITIYSEQERIDVSTYDGVRVGQEGFLKYMIHQFKVFVGDIVDDPIVLFKGQSTLAPSVSTVYLQIYNRVTGLWETLDTNNSANSNTDFRLAGDIVDFTDYKDASSVVSCRVYQFAT